MNQELSDQLAFIKSWLGTGSINIFGLPMSGKDTVGVKFAQFLGAKFLSSGLILREVEKVTHKNLTSSGALAPSDLFYLYVLPYFSRPDLASFPLILSSVGRWAGEEDAVLASAEAAHHPIKLAVLLELSEKDVLDRFEAAPLLGDRGSRPDDAKPEVFNRRIREFNEKTIPVLNHYESLGLLIKVPAHADRSAVLETFITQVYNYARQH